MPLWLLYRISDIFYIFIYHVVGYRKNVVWANLKNSFPEKSDAELTAVMRRFYAYFCDLLLETIKTLTISEKELRQMMTFSGKPVFERYVTENRNLVLVLGHFGNWEICGGRFSIEKLHHLFVIYHPLKNEWFDRLVYHMRTRHGTGLYPMNSALKGMLKDRNELNATAFVADQAASPYHSYWLTFLHQDTPVFRGAENIAKKLDYAVLYVSITRQKRGQYDLSAIPVSDNPKSEPDGEITRRFTAMLEEDIKKQPEIWLWTHRRWKHRRPVEIEN